jgi:hypothetical protein
VAVGVVVVMGSVFLVVSCTNMEHDRTGQLRFRRLCKEILFILVITYIVLLTFKTEI